MIIVRSKLTQQFASNSKEQKDEISKFLVTMDTIS